MTIDDTFQRLLGPSEAARQMLERIDPQLALSNRLAATESALQEIQRRQALIDNFSVKSRGAVAAFAERYGDAIHRPLIAEIVADSQRYDVVMNSFVDSINTSLTSRAIEAIQSNAIKQVGVAAAAVAAIQSNAIKQVGEAAAVIGRFSTVTGKLASQLAELNFGASAYASAISRASLVDSELERLRNTVGMTMLAELHERDLSLSESVEFVKSTVHREVKSGQSSTIGFAGWMTIITFVVNLWFAYQLSVRSDQRIADSEARTLQNVDSVRIELLERFDQLEDDGSTYYVVTTELNVRAGPSMKHEIRTVVLPNQYLKLLDSEGRWLHVEYFDYLDEVTRRGWVYKRLLKEVTLVD